MTFCREQESVECDKERGAVHMKMRERGVKIGSCEVKAAPQES